MHKQPGGVTFAPRQDNLRLPSPQVAPSPPFCSRFIGGLDPFGPNSAVNIRKIYLNASAMAPLRPGKFPSDQITFSLMEKHQMPHLKNTTAHFLLSEDGAVTVDWVVLTAALVGLGLAVMAVVSGGTEDLSNDIDGQLLAQEITAEFASALTTVDITPLAPGFYDSNEAWVAQLSDQSITDIMTGYSDYADAASDIGHPGDQYHDQYWLAYNQAVERGLDIPEA